MKKVILILIAAILALVLALAVIFLFNPFNLRDKLLGSIINSYLSAKIEGYAPLDQSKEATSSPSSDKNPLLNADQEATLENLGVDVAKLPAEITPAMQACFVEKLGSERAGELVAGASPSAVDLFKAGDCIGR